MQNIDKGLNKIIREAEQVLQASANLTKKTNIHISPGVNRAAKRMKEYRELTKKRRLSLDEKRALLSYTPKQVAKSRALSQKTYQNRLDTFRKLVGREIEPGEYAELRFLTPKQLVKKHDILAIEKPKLGNNISGNPEVEVNTSSTPDDFPDAFTAVEFPTNIRWWDIPESLRRSSTERRSRGVLYENQEVFWSNPESIKLGTFFSAGTDGISQTVITAIRQILVATGNTNILIDPKDSGARFAVYREEWNNVDELAPDYTTSRKYRKKQ